PDRARGAVRRPNASAERRTLQKRPECRSDFCPAGQTNTGAVAATISGRHDCALQRTGRRRANPKLFWRHSITISLSPFENVLAPVANHPDLSSLHVLRPKIESGRVIGRLRANITP